MVENDVGKTFIRQKKARIHYIEKLRALGIDPELMKFITVWKTANDDEDIKFEVNTSKYDYNFKVDWGDGNTETYEDSTISSDTITHKYTSKGSYIVKISGDIPYYYLYDATYNLLMEVSQWGDIVMKSFASTFYRCENLNITAKDTPDLRNVTSLANMFKRAWDFTGNQYFNDWDVSNVTNMSEMFLELVTFNQPLNDWDVSNVTNMSNMFNGAEKFNQPLNDWDVSSVTDMNKMFWYAYKFNGDIGDWNVSNVRNTAGMFNSASNFNQPLNDWNVSSVTNMEGMFAYTSNFNHPLNNWDVSNVTNMFEMFRGALKFNQNIGSWSTGNVTNMGYMFNKAEDFKDQDLSGWDVANGPSDKHKNFTYKSGGGNTKPKFP
jgi:surface protein